METDWKHERRLRAWDLYNKGWKQIDIAEALGVTHGAVSQWIATAQTHGIEALRAKKHPGPSPRLNAEQDRHLVAMLQQPADAHGFIGAVWTTPRVAEIIKRAFGISYHHDHVGRILHRLGFSVQKPQLRSRQRNQDAVDTWINERWPAIKKKAETEGYTIVFVDESGFYLLPSRVSTWALRGQPPVLEQTLSHDHLSVIGGITEQGTLYTMSYQKSINAKRCVEFLRHLVYHLGKVLVIWDGAPIHRSHIIKEYLSNEASNQVHLERLPGYAPECNPEEGVWHLLKVHELANVCTYNLKELWRELRLGVQRLRHKLPQLHACFHEAGYC